MRVSYIFALLLLPNLPDDPEELNFQGKFYRVYDFDLIYSDVGQE